MAKVIGWKDVVMGLGIAGIAAICVWGFPLYASVWIALTLAMVSARDIRLKEEPPKEQKQG